MTKVQHISIFDQHDDHAAWATTAIYRVEKGDRTIHEELSFPEGMNGTLDAGRKYYALVMTDELKPIRTHDLSVREDNDGAVTLVGTHESRLHEITEAASGRPGVGSDEPFIGITFFNYTKKKYTDGFWGFDTYSDLLAWLSISPTGTLDPDGTARIAASHRMASFYAGGTKIYLGWGYLGFGVLAYFKEQAFGLGPAPVWYVWQPSNKDNKWEISGKDPSRIFECIADGNRIKATPTAGQSSLFIEVSISPK
ncbi:MAG TPA: hypothetical protein VK195_02045 [Burkholderiaceae bacterium]|nr:hypothetical protein [Burkholderiaceae bacterium]